MADRGTATLIPTAPVRLAVNHTPLMPGGGSSGPLIPTVGIVFPSGSHV